MVEPTLLTTAQNQWRRQHETLEAKASSTPKFVELAPWKTLNLFAGGGGGDINSANRFH